MNFVKILHCADIHIGAAGSFLGALAETRRFETLITFEKILEAAEENNVQLILIAGDLFDSNKIGKVFFDRVFDAIEKTPVQIVFCAGNHDPLTANSPFLQRNLPANLHVLPARDGVITLDSLKTRVYGRSFAECYMKGNREFSLKPPADDYINLMCLHGELRADLESNYNSVTKEFIASSGMDYIALGHIHKRTEIGKLGNTYCAYCGCAEGQGFDELDQKGVYCGTISKQGCELEFLPIAQRIHAVESIDISSVSGSDEASELILTALKENYGERYMENLYKINLIGVLPPETVLSLAEITSRLVQKLYFVKLIDKTEPYIDPESLAAEKTLKGIFTRKMLEKIKSCTPDECEKLKLALKLGLNAFHTEVAFNEDQ